MAGKRERIAGRQRAAQAKRAARVEADLLGAYRQAWQAIRTELDTAIRLIREAEARGEPPGALRLLSLGRLEALEQQTAAQVRYLLDLNAIKITDAQADALLAGHGDAAQLLGAALPDGYPTAFPTLPFERLVGYSVDGQPLGMLLQELGPDAGQRVRKALVTGLARGLNPRDVARGARTALGGNMVRATTIARTEILRAYRTAALETYRANDDVVTGWVWVAELGNACPVCVAMHGTFMDSEDDFDSHPNCRCTSVPQTRSWADLGAPDADETTVEVEPGEDWFARQDEAAQRRTLGPGKFAAYQRGDIRLGDLVERTRSARWGGGRRERGLRDAMRVAA